MCLLATGLRVLGHSSIEVISALEVISTLGVVSPSVIEEVVLPGSAASLRAQHTTQQLHAVDHRDRILGIHGVIEDAEGVSATASELVLADEDALESVLAQHIVEHVAHQAVVRAKWQVADEHGVLALAENGTLHIDGLTGGESEGGHLLEHAQHVLLGIQTHKAVAEEVWEIGKNTENNRELKNNAFQGRINDHTHCWAEGDTW